MLKPLPNSHLMADLASHCEPDGTVVAERLFLSADLRRLGWTRRDIRRAVETDRLVALRRGSFLPAGTRPEVVAAARERGRLACISALDHAGVFVLRRSSAHLHFERGTSKHSPSGPTEVWHWRPLVRPPHPRATSVGVIDALIQATACQSPRAAIATLDSALYTKLLSTDDLDEIFENVPARRRVIRRLLDGRAESGPESLVRLMALALGFEVELQVRIRGVGRVDLLLDGWLIVECDSAAFHTGWESLKSDRRRDLAAAALGYTSIRPIAEDILYRPEQVIAALRGLRDARAAGGSAPRRA